MVVMNHENIEYNKHMNTKIYLENPRRENPWWESDSQYEYLITMLPSEPTASKRTCRTKEHNLRARYK